MSADSIQYIVYSHSGGTDVHFIDGPPLNDEATAWAALQLIGVEVDPNDEREFLESFGAVQATEIYNDQEEQLEALAETYRNVLERRFG